MRLSRTPVFGNKVPPCRRIRERDKRGAALLTWIIERTQFEWTACEDISFYLDLIPRIWVQGGDEVSDAPIHRFCTLARKMGVRSFVIEDASAREGVAEEIEQLEAFTPGMPEERVRAFTLTFLTEAVGDPAAVERIDPAHVISQSVIIEFPTAERRISYVFAATARICRLPSGVPLLNNFVAVRPDQRVEVGGRTMAVAGTFFCQQNGVTSVCGHTAVRTLVMNASGGAVSNAVLNDEWGIVPGRPIELPENAVEDALRSRGLQLFCYDLDKTARRQRARLPDDDIWTVLTGLAESGTPSLLVLGTGPTVDHVVPVIGHTVNTDEWHPQGAYAYLADARGSTSSSLWIDHLVINDDQLGPYYCLSRAGLFDRSGLATAVTPRRVIAMLPENADVSPLAAETLVRGIYAGLLQAARRSTGGSPPRWLTFLAQTTERRIFRTVLSNRPAYVRSLLADPNVATDPAATEIVGRIAGGLPDLFWMVEVSLPNIMLANKHKLGEFLVPTSGGRHPVPVAFRVPGRIGTTAGDEVSLLPFPIEGHTPMHSASREVLHW